MLERRAGGMQEGRIREKSMNSYIFRTYEYLVLE